MTFADVLKEWRRRKRLSQMALALAADVSTRHVSYLETGKAAPSRDMVMRLADALSVPLHARNEWFTSAGFAPVFQRRDLTSDDMQPFMAALQRLLDRHDPNPGWILDADWRIITTNGVGELLLKHLGIAVGDDLVEAMRQDPSRGGLIINWEEVVSHLAARLSAEARRRNDDATARNAQALKTLCPGELAPDLTAPAVMTTIKWDSVKIDLVSVQAAFNTAIDLSLSDLRAELFYSANAESEAALHRLVSDRHRSAVHLPLPYGDVL